MLLTVGLLVSNLAALIALAACWGELRRARGDLRAELLAFTPAQVTLTYATNGSITALVERPDSLATVVVPSEVMVEGPEWAARWAYEHTHPHRLEP